RATLRRGGGRAGATAGGRSRGRPVIATRAPAASSTVAKRAPSPELAPVTSATSPSRRNGASGSTRATVAAGGRGHAGAIRRSAPVQHRDQRGTRGLGAEVSTQDPEV